MVRINANLCVKCEAAAEYLRVKGLRVLCIICDHLHDLVSQIICLFIMTIDFFRVAHQHIGAFRQPDDSEHGKEFIPLNKSLPGKK